MCKYKYFFENNFHQCKLYRTFVPIIKPISFILMVTIHFDLTKIKAIVFEVDGVLSLETMPLHPTGEPMRVINTKDGYAMQLAVKQGITLGIISECNTPAVRKRFESLGFQYLYLKSGNKMNDFRDFINKTGFSPEEICYVGADITDYEVMQKAGLPACPADAALEIKTIARYISHNNGGQGVGRDIIEQTLKAQGKWMQANAFAFGW